MCVCVDLRACIHACGRACIYVHECVHASEQPCMSGTRVRGCVHVPAHVEGSYTSRTRDASWKCTRGSASPTCFMADTRAIGRLSVVAEGLVIAGAWLATDCAVIATCMHACVHVCMCTCVCAYVHA